MEKLLVRRNDLKQGFRSAHGLLGIPAYEFAETTEHVHYQHHHEHVSLGFTCFRFDPDVDLFHYVIATKFIAFFVFWFVRSFYVYEAGFVAHLVQPASSR